MRLFPIFTNFAAGELSRRMWSRTELEAFRAGVAEMTNFISTPHGPAMRRQGFEFNSVVPGTTGRLFDFIVKHDEAYIVTISNNGTLYIYNASNGVIDSSFPHTYTVTDISEMQVSQPPNANSMYFFTRGHAPFKLTYTVGVGFTAFAAVVFTSTPVEWVAGSYPGSVTFFQGRMWVGGTTNNPQSFWGSKSASYEDFTTGSLADDALSFSMSERGAIRWMTGIKNLVIGADNGEHIVTSEGGIIKPGDITVEQQSAFGSKRVQNLKIGNQAMYVSPDGRKLRDIGYKFSEDGWLSRDITFVSEHITNGHQIEEISYAQNPDNLLLLPSSSGRLNMGTYERSNDIIGFHKHITDGSFESITTVELNGTSFIWALILRDNGMNLELYGGDTYMDSWEQDTISGSGTITFSHLANKTVQIIDVETGAVHPDVTLDGAGSGNVSTSINIIRVGLQYVSTLKTLPLDVGHPSGSGMSNWKHWNDVMLRLIESAIPKVNGVRPPLRHASTPMGTAEPLFTGDIEISIEDWSQSAEILIEQDLPLPCMVSGIFGNLVQEKV